MSADTYVETAKFIASQALAGQKHEHIKLDGGKPIIRVGNTIFDLEQYLDAPTMTRRTVTLEDADSFAAYLGSQKGGRAEIMFQSDEPVGFTAIIDAPEPDTPSWCKHLAKFPIKHSNEWTEWWGRNGKEYGQVGFGQFIEDNLPDIVSPDGATLLEMVMTFEATKNIAFREATRIGSGQTQLNWVEEIKTGSVDVPERITIEIPVFRHTEPRKIDLRFKFRIVEQKLQLSYHFIRPFRVIELAGQDLVADVQKVLPEGTVILLGKAVNG